MTCQAAQLLTGLKSGGDSKIIYVEGLTSSNFVSPFNNLSAKLRLFSAWLGVTITQRNTEDTRSYAECPTNFPRSYKGHEGFFSHLTSGLSQPGL